MNHKESNLQQQCVAWFKAQYPQYAMLLTHVANEGNGNRVTGAIHKAEGTQAGVPDLLFFMPVLNSSLDFKMEDRRLMGYLHGLGIEFKWEDGKKSQAQKDFEHIFTAAGFAYKICRSFNEFKFIMKNWIAQADPEQRKVIASAHVEIEQAKLERERAKLKKVISKAK